MNNKQTRFFFDWSINDEMIPLYILYKGGYAEVLADAISLEPF